MNTVEQINTIEARPTGRGRPVTKNTARVRNATMKAVVALGTENPKVQFTAREVAKHAKVARAKVALALRWLDHTHGVLVQVDTTHQNRRARPELVYMLADAAPAEAIEARDARDEELARRAAERADNQTESSDSEDEEETA